MQSQRPNFGQTTTQSVPQSTRPTTPSTSQEVKKSKPEFGAIWVRQSKSDGSDFLKLRLQIPRAKLEQMLAATPTDGSSVPVTEFVAFKNRYKEEGTNRPDYRIFE